VSQCCVLCTLARPACSRSAGEPVASVNVRVVAEHASAAVLRGRSVLHSLQLLNTARWSSMQHSVAVDQSTQYQTARQCDCEFSRQ